MSHRTNQNSRITLKGIGIVVTRARSQASSFAKQLKSYGARVLCCPTIRIVPPKSFEPLDRAIARLDSYDWLIFTSANGVESFFARYSKVYGRAKIPRGLKTFAVGPSTAEQMVSFGIPVSKISKRYVAESILEDFLKVRGQKILIPSAEQARDILPKTLRARGAKVDAVSAYRTVRDSSRFPAFRRWLKAGKVDCITFTSSSTVTNLFKLLNSTEKNLIVKNKNISAASIGPITTRTLREHGWKPKIIAKKTTLPDLVESISRFYKN